MNFSFLSSIFKKNNKVLELPESLLVKKLKSVSKESNLLIFQNAIIYHHNQSFLIPLLIVDDKRGIYLFEYKDWSYDDLKNAKIEKASNQIASKDTLAYEKSHEFIKKRFNELNHNDGVPIFNYLLMENLNFDQYKHLNKSFQELLPQERIMFNDSSSKNIHDKMLENNRVIYDLPDASSIMSTLLTQYSVLGNDNKSYLASNEQIEFIDSSLQTLTTLNGASGTGKTSTILLKAISTKLKNPKSEILIIKPNQLACDLLKKKLLEMIERAIVEINPSSIMVITPYEFIDNPPRYLDLLICDDTWAYSKEFISDISNISNKDKLILVENSNNTSPSNKLNKNFRNQNIIVTFHKTNQHAKALQIISTLLQDNKASDILLVANDLGRVKLKDDLEDFIDYEAIFLDTKKSLVNQNLEGVILSSYEDIYPQEIKFVILINICFVDIEKLQYAYNLSTESVFVLYDTESDNLTSLRGNFENNKN